MSNSPETKLQRLYDSVYLTHRGFRSYHGHPTDLHDMWLSFQHEIIHFKKELGVTELNELLASEEKGSNWAQCIAQGLLGIARMMHVAANRDVTQSKLILAEIKELQNEIAVDKVKPKTIDDGLADWELEIAQDWIVTAYKQGDEDLALTLLEAAYQLADQRLGEFTDPEQVPSDKKQLAARSAYAVLLVREADLDKKLRGMLLAQKIQSSQLPQDKNALRMRQLQQMGSRRAMNAAYEGTFQERAALILNGVRTLFK